MFVRILFVCVVLIFTLDLWRNGRKQLNKFWGWKICLFFQTSEHKYADKLYAHKKEV